VLVFYAAREVRDIVTGEQRPLAPADTGSFAGQPHPRT
jgi:hypothetical protein